MIHWLSTVNPWAWVWLGLGSLGIGWLIVCDVSR